MFKPIIQWSSRWSRSIQFETAINRKPLIVQKTTDCVNQWATSADQHERGGQFPWLTFWGKIGIIFLNIPIMANHQEGQRQCERGDTRHTVRKKKTNRWRAGNNFWLAGPCSKKVCRPLYMPIGICCYHVNCKYKLGSVDCVCLPGDGEFTNHRACVHTWHTCRDSRVLGVNLFIYYHT